MYVGGGHVCVCVCVCVCVSVSAHLCVSVGGGAYVRVWVAGYACVRLYGGRVCILYVHVRVRLCLRVSLGASVCFMCLLVS